MKNFYLLAIIVATLFSCTKDLEDSLDTTESKLNDTESQLNDLKSTLEAAGISSNPVKVKHVYSLDDSGNHTMLDELEFIFISKPYSYIEVIGDNEYNIYTEFYLDTNQSAYGYLEFTYNSATKIITDKYLGLNYYNKYGDRIYLEYYGSNSSNESGDIVVNSIDLETGRTNISAKIEYTKDSNYSEYGTEGEATFEFDGKLRLIERNPLEEEEEKVVMQ